MAVTRTLRSTCPSPAWHPILSARVLGEFGDDPDRYRQRQARKNYAATSSITRASGKKKVATARFIRNDRLTDALMVQAFTALSASLGARALYNAERASGTEHNAALRILCQPARRHPARMLQSPHALRRGNHTWSHREK